MCSAGTCLRAFRRAAPKPPAQGRSSLTCGLPPGSASLPTRSDWFRARTNKELRPASGRGRPRCLDSCEQVKRECNEDCGGNRRWARQPRRHRRGPTRPRRGRLPRLDTTPTPCSLPQDRVPDGHGRLAGVTSIWSSYPSVEETYTVWETVLRPAPHPARRHPVISLVRPRPLNGASLRSFGRCVHSFVDSGAGGCVYGVVYTALRGSGAAGDAGRAAWEVPREVGNRGKRRFPVATAVATGSRGVSRIPIYPARDYPVSGAAPRSGRGRGRSRQRSVAPYSRSRAPTTLARTPAMSLSFSVRSGERMTTRSASERLPFGTWSPS